MARLWVWWDVWVRDFIVVIAIALSLWSTWISHQQIDRVRAEGAERRDQTCLIFERQQKAAVDQVGQTYRYLAGLTPKQLGEPLNRAVIANLPQLVHDATTAEAPVYCDAKGVGLPEPDPQLPHPPHLHLPK